MKTIRTTLAGPLKTQYVTCAKDMDAVKDSKGNIENAKQAYLACKHAGHTTESVIIQMLEKANLFYKDSPLMDRTPDSNELLDVCKDVTGSEDTGAVAKDAGCVPNIQYYMKKQLQDDGKDMGGRR
jgi:hypothetical protein